MKSTTPQIFALSLLCATALSGSVYASTLTCDDYKNAYLAGLSNTDLIAEAQKILEACKNPKVSQRATVNNVYEALRGKSFNASEKQEWTTWFQGLDKSTWNQTTALGLLEQFLTTNLSISEAVLKAPSASPAGASPAATSPPSAPFGAASPAQSTPSASPSGGQPNALNWDNVAPYNSGLSDTAPSGLNPSLLVGLPAGFTVNKFLTVNEAARKDFDRIKMTVSRLGVTLNDVAGWEHVLTFRQEHQPRRLPSTPPTTTTTSSPPPVLPSSIPKGLTVASGGSSSSSADNGSFSSSSSSSDDGAPPSTLSTPGSNVPSAGPAGQPYVGSPNLPSSTSGATTSTSITPQKPNDNALNFLDKSIFESKWKDYVKKLGKGTWDSNQAAPYPYPAYKAPGVLSGPAKQNERAQNEAAWKRAYQTWNDAGAAGDAPTPDSVLTASRGAPPQAATLSAKNRFKETILHENPSKSSEITFAARGWNEDDISSMYIAPFNKFLSPLDREKNKTDWVRAYTQWRDAFEADETTEAPPTPLSILNGTPRASSSAPSARPRFVAPPSAQGLGIAQQAQLRQQFGERWDAWETGGRTGPEPTPDSVARALGLISGPAPVPTTTTTTTTTSPTATSTRPRFKMPAGLSLSNQEQIALAGAFKNAWDDWSNGGRSGAEPTPASVARAQGHTWTSSAPTGNTTTTTPSSAGGGLTIAPPRGTPAKVQSVGGGTYIVTLPGEPRGRPATLLSKQELLNEIANGPANGTSQDAIAALRAIAPADVIAALPTSSSTSTPPIRTPGSPPPPPPGQAPSFSTGQSSPTPPPVQTITTTTIPSPTAAPSSGGTDLASLNAKLAQLKELPASRTTRLQIDMTEKKILELTPSGQSPSTPSVSPTPPPVQTTTTTTTTPSVSPTPPPVRTPSAAPSSGGIDVASLNAELARLKGLPTSRQTNLQIAAIEKKLEGL